MGFFDAINPVNAADWLIGNDRRQRERELLERQRLDNEELRIRLEHQREMERLNNTKWQSGPADRKEQG